MATHSSVPAWKILWQRSLAAYSPRGTKEWDTTERLSRAHTCFCTKEVITTSKTQGPSSSAHSPVWGHSSSHCLKQPQAAPPYSGSRAGTVGSQQTGEEEGCGCGRGGSTGLGVEFPPLLQGPTVLPSGTSPGSQLLEGSRWALTRLWPSAPSERASLGSPPFPGGLQDSQSSRAASLTKEVLVPT